jgi:hypothetical protein
MPSAKPSPFASAFESVARKAAKIITTVAREEAERQPKQSYDHLRKPAPKEPDEWLGSNPPDVALFEALEDLYDECVGRPKKKR